MWATVDRLAASTPDGAVLRDESCDGNVVTFGDGLGSHVEVHEFFALLCRQMFSLGNAFGVGECLKDIQFVDVD